MFQMKRTGGLWTYFHLPSIKSFHLHVTISVWGPLISTQVYPHTIHPPAPCCLHTPCVTHLSPASQVFVWKPTAADAGYRSTRLLSLILSLKAKSETKFCSYSGTDVCPHWATSQEYFHHWGISFCVFGPVQPERLQNHGLMLTDVMISVCKNAEMRSEISPHMSDCSSKCHSPWRSNESCLHPEYGTPQLTVPLVFLRVCSSS